MYIFIWSRTYKLWINAMIDKNDKTFVTIVADHSKSLVSATPPHLQAPESVNLRIRLCNYIIYSLYVWIYLDINFTHKRIKLTFTQTEENNNIGNG